MYERFYGLQVKPFRLSPDPHFFFTSATHKSALAHLRYGLYQGEGFVVLTGAPGTGKTTLMRTLLGELPRREMVIGELITTQLQADDLLRSIAAALHLDVRGSKSELLGHLQEFFAARGRAKQRILLVVDEAHNLPQSSFEELRMLSNFQQGARALLQCILLGQPPLRDALTRASMEQLQQRIIAAHHLHPLGAEETRAYILHRLRLAGWRGDPSFEGDALVHIYHYSLGIPRRINLLCDRLLLYGSLEALHHLDAAATTQVYGEWAAETGQGLGHEPLLCSTNEVTLAGLDRHDANTAVEVSRMSAQAIRSDSLSTASVHEVSPPTGGAVRAATPSPRIAAAAWWRPTLGVAAALSAIALLFSLWPQQRIDEGRAQTERVDTPSPVPHETTTRSVVDATPVAQVETISPDTSAATPAAALPVPVPEEVRVAKHLAPREMSAGAQELVNVDATLALSSVAASSAPSRNPRVTAAQSVPHDAESGKKSAPANPVIQKQAQPNTSIRPVDVASVAQALSPPAMPDTTDGDKDTYQTATDAPLKAATVPLSAEELAAVLARFQGAYEGGDMSTLVGLFARDARSDDAHDRDAIARTYQKLFNVTDTRHLTLKDMRWTEEGDAMKGDGQFGVTVREKGRDIESHYTGRIRLRIEKRDGKAVITQLEHRYTR